MTMLGSHDKINAVVSSKTVVKQRIHTGRV